MKELEDLIESFSTLGNSTTIAYASEDDEKKKVVFSFVITSFGFGEVKFVSHNGKVFCDNECMSKETVKEILSTFVDSSIFFEDICTLKELIEYDSAMGIVGRGGLPKHVKLEPGEKLPDYIEQNND